MHNSPQTVSKSIDNFFFLSHFRETKNGTPTNSQVELQTHRIGYFIYNKLRQGSFHIAIGNDTRIQLLLVTEHNKDGTSVPLLPEYHYSARSIL